MSIGMTTGNVQINNSGWHCPGCGKYHSPDTKTCPEPINKSISPHQVPAPCRWIPDTHPKLPPVIPYNDVVGNCPKCGLELHRVMGYVCSHNGCPTGLGNNTMLCELDNKGFNS